MLFFMFPSHLSVLSSSWIRLLLLQGACPFILSWPPLSLSVAVVHLAKGAQSNIPNRLPPLVVILDVRAPKLAPATFRNTIGYILQVISSNIYTSLHTVPQQFHTRSGSE